MEKSVDVVHRFARELRPAVLDDLGLIPALHTFVKTFSQRTRVHVQLQAFAGVEQLDIVKRTVLFRVAQEALTNVARHAKASRVEIKLLKLRAAVGLTIHDDGKSFPVERTLQANAGKRLGLLGMRERVEMVGGIFRVESTPAMAPPFRWKCPSQKCGGGGGRKFIRTGRRDPKLKRHEKITVLLADDHTIVREGFRKMLELEDDLEVVGEAKDGREAVTFAKKLRPAVMLMDIAMPLLNGLEATRQVLKAVPATKVLMLSAHNDDAYVTNAIESGAKGFLLKQTSAHDVCRAIREVQKGKTFFSPSLPSGRRRLHPAAPDRAGLLKKKWRN